MNLLKIIRNPRLTLKKIFTRKKSKVDDMRGKIEALQCSLDDLYKRYFLHLDNLESHYLTEVDIVLPAQIENLTNSLLETITKLREQFNQKVLLITKYEEDIKLAETKEKQRETDKTYDELVLNIIGEYFRNLRELDVKTFDLDEQLTCNMNALELEKTNYANKLDEAIRMLTDILNV